MQQTINKEQESSTNISLNDEVLKIFAKMPDALKIEVLHYAEYLLNKGIAKSSDVAIAGDDIPKKKYRQAGTMTGLILMSDDFDEPLAEMQEYMY
ncbi:MAG: hypothetical protein DCF20_20240 [Pseudanabaena sp.]|nr:MAG: hypothetical protein DCF20_20240 [Pseudanabaena sp.]